MYDPYDDNDREENAPDAPDDGTQNVQTPEYREQGNEGAGETESSSEYRQVGSGEPEFRWTPEDGYTRPSRQNYANQQRSYGYYGQQSPYVTPKQPKKARKKGSGWGLKLLIIVLIVGALAASCYFGANMAIRWLEMRETPSISAPQDEAPVRQEESHLNVSPKQDIPYTTVQQAGSSTTVVTDVSQVVENTMPAMVAINVIVTQTVQDPFGGFGGYFGFGYGGGSYEQDVAGSGSGIIIGQNDTELLIVSNNHVVGKAKEIAIEFIDGESAGAYIKGTDEDADLAVVAVKLTDMKQETLDSIKIAVMGSSDDLKLGEPAIAIGNALGYGQSVTVGYISALEREVKLTDGTMTLLQTDAAINPGNSGGALLNIRGEVIGINSAKYSDTNVEGMCYAIPISDAIPKINELMNSVAVPDSEKPFLGIQGQDVPESYRSYFGWPEGVYVVEITPNSPAALAGLHEGDIIVGFNGEEVTAMTELQEMIASCAVGDRVSITVMRSKSGDKGSYTLGEVELTAILISRGEVENNG